MDIVNGPTYHLNSGRVGRGYDVRNIQGEEEKRHGCLLAYELIVL